MHLTSDNKFKKLVVIGDRVLIRPSRPHERTKYIHLQAREGDIAIFLLSGATEVNARIFPIFVGPERQGHYSGTIKT